ncbi:hypothetical protein [Candidatus Bandiella numerosa]|uniref:hypothetical protein n=1 Tax=Candidatus Bandiella numerosa TaxID=2570586 RepID=UPI001F16FABD|nr:hypothetical protein [Candidatus Bandiella numerosa]
MKKIKISMYTGILKPIKLQSLKFTTSVKPPNKNDGTGITNSITMNMIVNKEKVKTLYPNFSTINNGLFIS